MVMRKNPYPRHGTSARYTNFSCRCIACSKKSGAVSEDYVVRWSLIQLQRQFGIEMLRSWFDEEQITEWQRNGLSDSEADIVSVTLGVMPWDVWGGWLEAGLDYKEQVNVGVE